ncbi:MAG: hypothetical protein D6689_19480 [Deltaproteobacteria bacterium]|nr:MAG: hypothetical protein D6689_19480 [Deltaproteobacteria bacterium]
MSKIAVSLTASAVVFCLTSTAAAQPSWGYRPAGHRAPPRDGLLIGFGLGGGNISAECATEARDLCDEVLESGSLDFHVGAMLAPRLGVMLDVWPMVYREDRLTITHVITTAAVRFWATPRLWLQGGVGSAYARFKYDGILIDEDVQTDTVAGAMAAIGVEVVRRPRFGIDVQLRGGTGFYEEDEVKGKSAAFQVGFTWF